MAVDGDVTIFRATLATGVCEGLHVTAAGGLLQVGPGYGYLRGERFAGGYEFDLSAEKGWKFLRVGEGLTLGVVLVERGQAVAYRDLRPRLTVWQWVRGEAGLCYHPTRREVVTRLQGAVQARGLWECAVAYAPFPPGTILEPSEVYLADLSWDKPPLQAGGMILETVGIAE